MPRRPLRALLLVAACALVALALPAGAAAQTSVITTVAGTGTNGFTGDESAAIEADLGTPVGLLPLPDGGFVVTSQVPQMPIRRVMPDGTIVLLAGGNGAGQDGDGGPATSAELNAPNGMTLMPNGAILVADSNSNRIRGIGTDGMIYLEAGSTGEGGGGFGGDGSTPGEMILNFPTDVALMPDGGYLIADTDNHRVRRVDGTGTVSTIAGTGTAGSGGDGGPATNAQLNKPSSVAVESDGDVLIADRFNHRIRRVSGGIITTVAGTGTPGAAGDGGDATLAQLNSPNSVAVAPDGGFVVADQGNHGVRRVDPDGKILMTVGDGSAGFSGDGGPAGEAQLNSPADVGFTPSGDLLITDTGNHRVRRVVFTDEGEPGPGPGPGPELPPPSFTPPPPAPEPPPQVTAVTVAEPDGTLEVGETNVVEAQLSGGRPDRIDWDVTGDGSTDVSCDGSQPALMFRPTSRATRRQIGNREGLRLTARPVVLNIPAGLPPTRFDAPLTRPPVPPVLIKVAAQLDKQPATYACGSREDLALTRKPVEDPRRQAIAAMVREARTRCDVPMTIKKGALEATGCFLPIQQPADIPEGERGILLQFYQDLLRQRGLAETSVRTLTLDLALTLSREISVKLLGMAPPFMTAAPAKVNGMTLSVNDLNAFTIVFPGAGLISSSNASAAIGDMSLDQPKRFVLDIAEREGKIALDGLKRSAASKLKSLGGFPFVPGNVDVTWRDGTATVKAWIQLPSWMSLGRERARASVELRANNAEGLVIDKAKIGPLGVDIGALRVDRLQLEYTRVNFPGGGLQHVWNGSLRACIIKACLDMAPDKGGIRIVNGTLEYLGLSITFPAPIPIATGLDLRAVGFRIGLEPTRFGGTVGLTAGQLVEIDGGVSVIFASADEPWIFRRAEVGNAFPTSFEGQRHTTFTLAIGAEAFLREVPIAGRLKLGDAYLLYEAPAFVAFGGGVSASFKDWISITGRVDGAINAENGRFSITGNTRACLFDFLCTGGIASVSSVGAGGCISLGPVQVGGGLRFDPFKIIIWPLDGCKWTRFIDRDVRGRPARAAQSGGLLRTVTVKPGDPSVALKLDGADGAPQIRVSGPGGKSFVSTEGPGLAGDKTIRILRSVQERFTVIGLQDAPPGDYRVEVLPGSPEVTTLGEAKDPPAAKADVTVKAGPRQHVLRYDILRRPRQRVIFQELGSDGRARDLGAVTGGGRGTIRFTPTAGDEVRRIRATFELDGLIAEQQVVARFRAPSPRLARVRGLRASRTGKGVAVRWRAVPGATLYVVVATLSDGSQRTLSRSSTRARLAAIPRTSRVRIRVDARAEGRRSLPSAATLAARGRLKTKFGPLPAIAKRKRQ